MEYSTFLEELEKRLNTLEDELSKYDQKNKNDHMLENLIHTFDEAMDKNAESVPGITEKNLRLMDF